jgi:hypothetical protein
MSLINQAGVYRGIMTTSGVGLTKNQFPQFICGLVAAEYYDEVQQQWINWEQSENKEMMFYGCLYDKDDKETLNSKQVKLVTGWDGLSFETLNDMDCNGVPVLFRVEERSYDGNTNLQVTWIDDYEASPTRSVKKLDANAAKDLTARYAAVLDANKAPAKPVSAPKPAAAPPVPTAAPATPPVPTAPPVKPAAPKTPSPKASKKPAAAPAAGGCTGKDAWNTVVALKSDRVSQDTITEVWLKTVAEVAPGNTNADLITPVQWATIRDKVVAQVSAL